MRFSKFGPTLGNPPEPAQIRASESSDERIGDFEAVERTGQGVCQLAVCLLPCLSTLLRWRPEKLPLECLPRKEKTTKGGVYAEL